MSDESEVAALHEKIDRLEAVIEDQADRIDQLLREKAQDRQRIAELEDYRAENEHDKATIRQQVTSTEQTDPAADGESDESAARDDSMTPMERLVRLGEDSIMTNVTASVRRAEAIATHFRGWASRTPNGLVVKDHLKNLLETAVDERLAWKQVYRAARALEQFTKGAIRFEKHRRHGWMLVAEPAIVSRLGRASSVNGG
jgi:chromosome segregation ATPase